MLKSHLHMAHASHLNLNDARKFAKEVDGINRKTAIIVPAILGSMPFFWFCVVLALCSLPAVLTAFDTEVIKGALGLSNIFPQIIIKVSLIALVAWIAQTFIQLVALPILQVSSNASQAMAEAHTETILDRLDLDTAGGLPQVRDELLAAIKDIKQ
jgi:hypothetical protein